MRKLAFLLILLVPSCSPQVSAPVVVSPNDPTVSVQPGAVDVRPGAVVVDPNILVKIGEQLETIEATMLSLRQTAETTQREVTSGRDSNAVAVNLSGSGWPFVAVAGAALAALAYAWWQGRQRKLVEESASDVAGAVKRLPTAARNEVLERLDGAMRNEDRWKTFLADRGRLAKRG